MTPPRFDVPDMPAIRNAGWEKDEYICACCLEPMCERFYAAARNPDRPLCPECQGAKDIEDS